MPSRGRRGRASEPPQERPYFLFVGRLEKIKGLDDVIPVFRDYPGADLLIAGDGEYAAHLRALAAGPGQRAVPGAGAAGGAAPVLSSMRSR